MSDAAPPDILFHYTSASGVLGIFQSGSVWATSIHYLNDASEFAYALQLSREILLEEIEPAGGNTAHRTTCEDYLNVIQRLAVFVFSLSAEGDLLSQWRAYCPPEGGYGIAFDTAELVSASAPQGFTLVKCEYDRATQIDLLRPVLRRVIVSASELPDGADGIELHPRHTAELANVAAALKHPSFREEREWRLVWTAGDLTDLKFRARRSLIIPYRELSLSENLGKPIKHVVVGPNRHPELAGHSLRHLATKVYGWPIRVIPSSSPFRVLD